MLVGGAPCSYDRIAEFGGFVHGFSDRAIRKKADIFQVLKSENGRNDELCYADRFAAYIKLKRMGMLLVGLKLAVLAAVVGVAAAILSSCGIGLAFGTDTWCSPLAWFVGSLFAIVVAIIGGLPLWLLFRRFGLRRHWQYVLGGVLCALPVWYLLAGPFDSARWQHAGGFDTLNYLGSGAFGGFFFWLFSRLPRGDSL